MVSTWKRGYQNVRTALDPADFVGKVIDHRFKEPDGSLSWYRGIIEKQIGRRNSWTFEIEYDCGDKEYNRSRL